MTFFQGSSVAAFGMSLDYEVNHGEYKDFTSKYYAKTFKSFINIPLLYIQTNVAVMQIAAVLLIVHVIAMFLYVIDKPYRFIVS